MSLQALFSVKFNHKIVQRTVAVGKFDSEHPALCAATTQGKIFVHTPHGQSVERAGRLIKGEDTDLNILNVNQSVRALAAGRLNPNISRDILIVGTPSHILAYDVQSNADLFYKEIPDGVNCLQIGTLSGVNASPVVVLGGNCAIQGFDFEGNDIYWTVTGDNVTSLCICDFNNDGKNELVVGSEDFDIRVFKHDELIAEMTETEAVTHLMTIGGNMFAYALANGTLGIYAGQNRIWRIKSKNVVTSLLMYDIDADNNKELVTGWSNGKVDFRRIDTGEVLVKEHMTACVAGLADADYRMDGNSQLICCSVDGEVRGYLPIGHGGHLITQDDPGQEILRDLALQIQNCQLELESYKANAQASKLLTADAPSLDINREALGIIPADTQLQTSLYVNAGSETDPPCVELFIATTNDTIVRCIMVFAEGVFPGESFVIHPNLASVTSSLKAQLKPDKDVAVDLHVKVLVGYRNSIQFHVFELSRTLPKFSMYALCNQQAPQPEGYVMFTINDRPHRVALWINENFLLQEEFVVAKDGKLDARFLSLRGAGTLFIQADIQGQIVIRCNDMDLCGEVIQAMAQFLNIGDLNSVAEFPSEIAKLLQLLEKVNELYLVKDKLSAEMADQVQLAKALLIRGEDARLMKDMLNMKKNFNDLYNYNQSLISQYKVRCNNHEELLTCLKQVNQIVQRAGRLRVGKPKTDLINACRGAIKENTFDSLPKIIRTGAT